MAAREQAEMLAVAGHLPSQFVLRWGIWGSASPLPARIRRGRMGECYANAGRLAGGAMIYCEGLAMRADLPVALEHAWLLDAETGCFVDPTWPEVGGEYLGVPFRTDYLLRVVLQTGKWGLLRWPTPEDPAEFLEEWSGREDSNLQPPGSGPGALTD